MIFQKLVNCLMLLYMLMTVLYLMSWKTDGEYVIHLRFADDILIYEYISYILKD